MKTITLELETLSDWCPKMAYNVQGFAMAVFIRKEFSKPLLQNQCYTFGFLKLIINR